MSSLVKRHTLIETQKFVLFSQYNTWQTGKLRFISFIVLKVQDKNQIEKGVEHVGASSCLKYIKILQDDKGVKKASMSFYC